jgi:hypothetical protein
MDAFFAQVQEGFEKLGRDISVAVDKLGSDYNRANGALKRAETARKTGIVTERNARLSAFPEYVCELGEAAKVVDVSENAIASLPRALAGLTRVHRLCASHNALVSPASGSLRSVGFPESPASGAEQARVASAGPRRARATGGAVAER